MKEIAQEMINAEKQRLDIGQPGLDFMECVLNPRGSETGTVTVARLPDGNGSQTFLVQESGTYTFANGANTSCWIQLVGHSVTTTTSDQQLQITYGADAADPTATMTTVVEAYSNQYVLMGSLLSSYVKGRMIGCYVRVASVSDDTATGRWYGYNAENILRSGAATYNPNNVIYAGIKRRDNEEYDVHKGITVRRSLPANCRDFVVANASIYAGKGADQRTTAYGGMPLIRGAGLSNGSWIVTWGSVMEVEGAGDINPVACSRSEHEKELDQMIDEINDAPITTEANTFGSILKAVFSRIAKVGKWAFRNAGAIAKVGKTIIKLAGS
jgi:hypothetical protein